MTDWTGFKWWSEDETNDPGRPYNEAEVAQVPKYLGRHEWERLHDRIMEQTSARFAHLGWTWQPAFCRCKPLHRLDTGRQVRRGRY